MANNIVGVSLIWYFLSNKHNTMAFEYSKYLCCRWWQREWEEQC